MANNTISFKGVDARQIWDHLQSRPEPIQRLSESEGKRVLRMGPYVLRRFAYALNSFATLAELYAAGMPVEKPLLLIEGEGLPTLITEYVEGENYINVLLEETNPQAKMKKLGECLYLFHSCGYFVSDSHPKNYIISDSPDSKAIRIDVNTVQKFPKDAWNDWDDDALAIGTVDIRDCILVPIAHYLATEKRVEALDDVVLAILDGYTHDRQSKMVAMAITRYVKDVKSMIEEAEKSGKDFASVYRDKVIQDIRNGKIKQIATFEK